MAGGAVGSYAARLALAPMVRGCTLPTRLLALRNGADLVWSELPDLAAEVILAPDPLERCAPQNPSI